MRQFPIRAALVACAMGAFVVGDAGADPPAGWVHRGNQPQSYETGVVHEGSKHGKACATLKSIDEEIDGFGTLMQTIQAEEYRGERVRFSADVKTAAVDEWAGLWMRVDGEHRGVTLAFDNMSRRPIKGTTDWQRYSVVLDVPTAAEGISFGVLLNGTGQVWLDGVALERVEQDVSVTDMNVVPKKPVNLGFEN